MIQVIHRAFDILEFIARDKDREFGLGEIANSLNLNHGTCANIIKTLVSRGYIEQPGKKQGYKLGANAYYLTDNFSNKKELLNIASDPISELNREINESCILAIMKDNMRVTLLKKLSTHELQVVAKSEEKDIYQTATGRIILACMERQKQETFIEKFGLPNTMWAEINSKKELITELDKIKEKQFAIHFDGEQIVGIGAPIYKKGEVIASVGVYLPTVRFNPEAKKFIFSKIAETTKQINKELSRLND